MYSLQGILINFFGTDNTSFTIGSEYTDPTRNVTSLAPRTYTKFTDTATEVGLSRSAANQGSLMQLEQLDCSVMLGGCLSPMVYLG
jgi:hypothetical protein